MTDPIIERIDAIITRTSDRDVYELANIVRALLNSVDAHTQQIAHLDLAITESQT